MGRGTSVVAATTVSSDLKARASARWYGFSQCPIPSSWATILAQASTLAIARRAESALNWYGRGGTVSVCVAMLIFRMAIGVAVRAVSGARAGDVSAVSERQWLNINKRRV